MDIGTELTLLIDQLAKAEVPYALCGGLALAVHGHSRAERNIDFLVREADISRARKMVRETGFLMETVPLFSDDRKIRIERIAKFAGCDVLMLHLVVGDEALDEVWNTRVSVTWRGRQLWCVSRQGLVTMKLAAGRPKDLADIAALEGSS